METTPDNPAVSIAILTYNRGHLVKKLLAELHELKYFPLEIIVVDNHSEDDTETIVKEGFANVKYIRTDRNLGAVGRNIGMQSATGEIVITLDDDITGIDDSDIANIIAAFNAAPKIGAINFRVCDAFTGKTINWVHHCKAEEYEGGRFDTYEISEGAVAFRKGVISRVGCYPERFFISHEGPDLAFRIIEAGFDVIYIGSIVVKHSRATEGRTTWRNYYFNTRNLLWLAVRNFPSGYAARFLARGVFSMFVYSLRDGYVWYWFKAIADGVIGIAPEVRARSVLSRETMARIKRIDSMRPNVIYMIKKRLFQRQVRI